MEGALQGGALPVILGGDHSLAMGSISALSNFHHAQDASIGVLWIDAHADMNTPATTPSGNIHGMPMAHMLGEGMKQFVELANRHPAVDASRVAMLGLRDIDSEEGTFVRESGVRAFTMTDIDRRGFPRLSR